MSTSKLPPVHDREALKATKERQKEIEKAEKIRLGEEDAPVKEYNPDGSLVGANGEAARRAASERDGVDYTDPANRPSYNDPVTSPALHDQAVAAAENAKR